MTREDKQLLLTDLCGRLPYGVNVKTTGDNESYTLLSINSNKNIALIGLNFDGVYATSKIKIDEVKPYLRPMSSMTEEEKIELYQIAGFYYLSNNELLKDEWRQFSGALSENKLFLPYPIWEYDLNKVYDWLNKYHFDYRGLIEKGLALEVPEDMY